MIRKTALSMFLLGSLALTGCVNNAAETPSWGNGEQPAGSTTSQSASSTSDGTSTNNPTGPSTNNPDGTNPAESGKPGTQETVPQPKSTDPVERGKELAKIKDLKVDKNGNPYTDSTIVVGGGFEEGKEEESPKTSEGNNGVVPDDILPLYKPTNSDIDAVLKLTSDYQKAVKSKNWKSACEYVYLGESTKAECIKKLEEIFGVKSVFVTFTEDNVQMVKERKNFMVAYLKDKPYEESQRASYVREDGKWKIVV